MTKEKSAKPLLQQRRFGQRKSRVKAPAAPGSPLRERDGALPAGGTGFPRAHWCRFPLAPGERDMALRKNPATVDSISQ